jgi:hypothetical protein
MKAANITELAPYMHMTRPSVYKRIQHPEQLSLSEIIGIGKYYIVNGEMTAEEFRAALINDFKF